jgi:hypothetical protein
MLTKILNVPLQPWWNQERNTKVMCKLLLVRVRRTVFGSVRWPAADWTVIVTVFAEPHHDATCVVIVATWQAAQ